MAKLDWETSRDQLDAAILALEAAELAVASAVRDRFNAVGVPYNAVFTNDVDTTKLADIAANSVAFAEWVADTTEVHNDAVKSVQYGESLIGAQGPSVGFNPGVFEAKQILSGLVTRITSLVGRVDESTIAVLIDFRSQLSLAYGARPKDLFTGEYGVIKKVVVSSDETLTIQEAEVELGKLIAKTAALVSELVFVP